MAARRMSDAQLDHELEALRRILVTEVPVAAESETRFRRAIQDEIRRRERNREWWGAEASAAMAAIVTAGIYSTAFTLTGRPGSVRRPVIAADRAERLRRSLPGTPGASRR